ncbi:MAG: hypothetical protein ACKVQR_04510 [Aquabacterium sp.]
MVSRASRWFTTRAPHEAVGRPDVAGVWTEDELAVLRPFAAMERIPQGAAEVLAKGLGRTGDAVRGRISIMRQTTKEQNGAEGSKSVRVPRVAPSAAAPGSERAVSSPTLVAAVQARVAPCPVSPVAGAASPRAFDMGLAPARPSPGPSPGMLWARAEMTRGVGLDKLLSTAGDRLDWRDRQALRVAG